MFSIDQSHLFAGQSVLQTTSTTVRRHSTTSRRHAMRQSGRTRRYWIRLDHRRLTRGSSVRRGNMSSSRMYFSWDWQWLQITRQLEFKARPTTYCLTTSSYYDACRPPVCLFEEQASQHKQPVCWRRTIQRCGTGKYGSYHHHLWSSSATSSVLNQKEKTLLHHALMIQ